MAEQTCIWCGAPLPDDAPPRSRTCPADVRPCAEDRAVTRRLWDPGYAASQARSRARWLVKAAETGREVSRSQLAYARRVLAGEVDPQATRRLVPGSQAEASIRRAAERGYEPALLILPPWAVRQAARRGLEERDDG